MPDQQSVTFIGTVCQSIYENVEHLSLVAEFPAGFIIVSVVLECFSETILLILIS